MTLLEILVKELPGKGGWPYPVYSIEQDDDGTLYDNSSTYRSGFTLPLAIDWLNGMVTAKVYEAALAGCKKVAWSGEGLPPVGCECEVDYGDVELVDGLTRPNKGDVVKVVAHETTPQGSQVAIIYWIVGHCARAHALIPEFLRPLRSEEERKRDEAIAAMKLLNIGDYDDPGIIYSAIAAGEIPHVKIV